MKTPEQKETEKQLRIEDRKARKSFNKMVSYLKRKDAIVEVEINGKIIFKLIN